MEIDCWRCYSHDDDIWGPAPGGNWKVRSFGEWLRNEPKKWIDCPECLGTGRFDPECTKMRIYLH